MNLSTKQKQTHRYKEQTCCQGGGWVREWKIGHLGLAGMNIDSMYVYIHSMYV